MWMASASSARRCVSLEVTTPSVAGVSGSIATAISRFIPFVVRRSSFVVVRRPKTKKPGLPRASGLVSYVGVACWMFVSEPADLSAGTIGVLVTTTGAGRGSEHLNPILSGPGGRLSNSSEGLRPLGLPTRSLARRCSARSVRAARSRGTLADCPATAPRGAASAAVAQRRLGRRSAQREGGSRGSLAALVRADWVVD